MDPQQAQSRYVQMPDNSYVEWPEGVSAEDFKAKVLGRFGNQPPAPEPFGGVSTNLEHEPYKPVHSLRDVGDNAVRAASNFGAGVLQAPYLIGHAILDPKQTAKEVWASFHDPANIDPTGTFQLAKQLKSGRAAELAGNLVGGAAMGEMGGAAADVGPYRSPVVPAAEAYAERLMKAILPQEGVTPGNVKAAMNEAPAIRAFAQRTGNPLRTIPEGKVAAQGVADEGLAHYRNQILAPNAEERITIENGASPTLGNTATLGQIEKRISDINDLIRGSARTAKSVGQEMTAAEKLGLENEAGALRSKLYQNLSQKTGISPEDIQSLREGYGGQYTLKNALESGHYGRLTRVGAASQGEGVGVYPSKSGLIEKAITTLRGGPEAIANRQFRKAIRAFEPREPSYVQPNPPAAKPFAGPYMSDEMARRIGAVGTDQGVQPTPAPPQRSLNGPMAKAASVVDAERAAKAFQDEQNQAFHARRAANQATAGKRLKGDQ